MHLASADVIIDQRHDSVSLNLSWAASLHALWTGSSTRVRCMVLADVVSNSWTTTGVNFCLRVGALASCCCARGQCK
jgi:hypothetical protein